MSMNRGTPIEPAVQHLFNLLEQAPPKDQKFLDEAIATIKTITQLKSAKIELYEQLSKTIGKSIQSDAQLNAGLDTQINGTTLLIKSLFMGHTQIAEQLLIHKADPNEVDRSATHLGHSPLYLAARFGFDQVTEQLLNHKADPNLKIPEGQSPLFWAAKHGHTKITSQLLEKKAHPNICDKNNKTALSVAIDYGHAHIVYELLKYNADPNQFCSPGPTPLAAAIEKNNLNIVDLLLTQKADPNLHKPDGTPPILSAWKKNPQLVYKLLEYKANPNLQSSTDDTLLVTESWNGTEMVNVLLQHKADPNLLSLKSDHTPLTAAIQQGHQSTVTLLLESKANFNLYTAKGMPPLSVAILVKSLTVTRQLLEYKANPNQRTNNKKGIIPLMYAVDKGHTSMVSLLLEHKANPNLAGTFEEKNQTTVVLNKAAVIGSTDIVNLLLEAGARLDAQDQEQRTALDLAIHEKELEVTGLLLDKQASIRNPRRLYEFLITCSPQASYTFIALNRLLEHQKHSRELKVQDQNQLQPAEYKELELNFDRLSKVSSYFKMPTTRLLGEALNDILPRPLVSIISEYDNPLERCGIPTQMGIYYNFHLFTPKIEPKPEPAAEPTPPSQCCCVM